MGFHLVVQLLVKASAGLYVVGRTADFCGVARVELLRRPRFADLLERHPVPHHLEEPIVDHHQSVPVGDQIGALPKLSVAGNEDRVLVGKRQRTIVVLDEVLDKVFGEDAQVAGRRIAFLLSGFSSSGEGV